MGEKTAIGWTHHTFNPWWGCVRVSPGCEHCYAETFAKRTGHDIWGPTAPRRFFGDAHWNEPRKWNAKAQADGVHRRVFCASMADVFEDRRDLDEPRGRLLYLIEQTPWLDWLLLTKRPEKMLDLAWLWEGCRWPDNVWAGTTAESQEWADERIPSLLRVPAAVRFLSCEPLLGPLDLRGLLDFEIATEMPHYQQPRVRAIDWVITGGESAGPLERRLVAPLRIEDAPLGDSGTLWRPKPDALEWVRSLRDQCQSAGVSFFHKQWGGPHPHSGGRDLDGREWNEIPESKGEAACTRSE